MGDKKYGKLYTEADVLMIVERCLEEDVANEDEAQAIIATFEGKFSGMEPTFVLLGRDRLAVGTIHHYYKACLSHECVRAHLDGIEHTMRLFEEWRDSHPDTIKKPD